MWEEISGLNMRQNRPPSLHSLIVFSGWDPLQPPTPPFFSQNQNQTLQLENTNSNVGQTET